jgi:lipooligosaccharide transport system permease protein
VRWLTTALDWQSRAVLSRHVRVHLRLWYTAFLPPAAEPILMLLAFGLGLGGWVAGIAWHGRDVSYLAYVAPGMLAYTTFVTAMLQGLYGAFIRMRYQRTWEGQLTTQIELRHVVWGEVLWAAFLATFYAAIVSVVLLGARLAGFLDIDVAALPLALPLVFVAACAFAALGLMFTALVPTIEHMNLPLFLIVLPLAFVSGTYFPVDHPALRPFSLVNPLYHLAETFRGLLLGGPVAGALASVLGLVTLMLAVLVPLDMRLLRRRVLGD